MVRDMILILKEITQRCFLSFIVIKLCDGLAEGLVAWNGVLCGVLRRLRGRQETEAARQTAHEQLDTPSGQRARAHRFGWGAVFGPPRT